MQKHTTYNTYQYITLFTPLYHHEKKLKVAGQPKIDLKQFGEGKDLNYELQIDCLPSVVLKNFDKFKATSFKVKIEEKIIEEKLKEINLAYSVLRKNAMKEKI